MIVAEYVVDKIEFLKKMSKTIKIKTRSAMKAYSLNEFRLDDKNNVATCKVKLKKHGVIKQLPHTYSVYYYTEDIEGNDSDFKLKLHISTISLDNS